MPVNSKKSPMPTACQTFLSACVGAGSSLRSIFLICRNMCEESKVKTTFWRFSSDDHYFSLFSLTESLSTGIFLTYSQYPARIPTTDSSRMSSKITVKLQVEIKSKPMVLGNIYLTKGPVLCLMPLFIKLT